MKKTIITSLFLLIVSLAYGQNQVSLPDIPMIPETLVVSPNAIAALSSNTTNSVFIDQNGDNIDVNITQEGAGNKSGSALRPIYLRGIDQTYVSKQIGNNNEIFFEGRNNSVGENQGLRVTIQQYGNNNTIDSACGQGTASDNLTELTGCKKADLNFKFTGNNNGLQFRGTGDNIISAVTVTGDYNNFNIDALNNYQSQTITVSGNYNQFNLTQKNTGVSGSSIEIHQIGDQSKFTVSQAGTIDNVLYIKSISNLSTFNIIQKN